MPAEYQARPLWDVIVIGGGPAGATAACATAQAGLRTLVVDSKAFPRRKVCGGCLNRVSVELVQQWLGTEHELWKSAVQLDRLALRYSGRGWQFPLPAGYAIDRRQLDQSLVQRAVALGAEFRDATTARLQIGAAGLPAVTRASIPADKPAGSDLWREIELSGPHGRQVVRGRVVIAACGLAGRLATEDAAWQPRIARGSRVGVETLIVDHPQHYPAGAIHMLVGREGYVGLAQLADGQMHVAAAVDRGALQRWGPRELVARIMQQAGGPPLAVSPTSQWRGTPPLTTRAARIADHRLFVIGDAAGYVEPFTGEGIRWALESALGVAPLAIRAADDWNPELIAAWHDWYGTHIARRQRLCRGITWGLKHALMRWLAGGVLDFSPRVAQGIVDRLNTSHN